MLFIKTAKLSISFKHSDFSKSETLYSCKRRTLIFQKNHFYLPQCKPFKDDEKCFLFHVKVSFLIEIFTFLCWLFGYVEKRLDKKAMVNFKICEVTH